MPDCKVSCPKNCSFAIQVDYYYFFFFCNDISKLSIFQNDLLNKRGELVGKFN